jgi:hypothetical protein
VSLAYGMGITLRQLCGIQRTDGISIRYQAIRARGVTPPGSKFLERFG